MANSVQVCLSVPHSNSSHHSVGRIEYSAYGPEERLRTDGCKRTRRLAGADEDLLELGEGTVPEEKGDLLRTRR